MGKSCGAVRPGADRLPYPLEEVQCSTMGVFAPLTGVVGALQAMEAEKLLVNTGETLNGRLLLLDAKQSEWRTVRVKKDPVCRICSGA